MSPPREEEEESYMVLIIEQQYAAIYKTWLSSKCQKDATPPLLLERMNDEVEGVLVCQEQRCSFLENYPIKAQDVS